MSQPEDERGHDGLTNAERIEQMTRPIQEWWPAMRSAREAELEAQVEALQRENERLKAPITAMEWSAAHMKVGYNGISIANEVIASRAQSTENER
jgi:cell division protein FtsB